jgi:hypothetical protein
MSVKTGQARERLREFLHRTCSELAEHPRSGMVGVIQRNGESPDSAPNSNQRSGHCYPVVVTVSVFRPGSGACRCRRYRRSETAARLE